jgi:hypothetical protein
MGNAVEYEEARFRVKPTNILPFVDISDTERRHTVASWPWKRSLAPISPEAESYTQYGPFVRHEAAGVPLVTSTQDPELRGIHVAVRWPEPLQNLMGILAGPDPLFHQAKMVEIAQESVDDLQAAIHKARDIAGSYVTQGWTIAADVALWPLLTATCPTEGLSRGHLNQTLKAVASKLRLGEEEWETAQRSPVWRKRMEARHTITRA